MILPITCATSRIVGVCFDNKDTHRCCKANFFSGVRVIVMSIELIMKPNKISSCEGIKTDFSQNAK
jgi:hypothetical protein